MSTHVARETKKQNVVIDGVKYKAVAESDEIETACDYCALSSMRTNLCRLDVAKCNSSERHDGQNVYFVVKPKKVKPTGGQS